MRRVALLLTLTTFANADVGTALRDARKRLVADLEAIAAWAQENKLYKDRNQTWETVLIVAPDHAEARKILRYRKKKGEWLRGRPPNPRNLNKALTDWLSRMARARKRFADTVTEILDEKTARARPELVKQVIAIAPDHDGARALKGQARYGDKWQLIESVRGRKQRDELKLFAMRSLKEIVPKATKVTDAERAWGPRWRSAFATPTYRLVTACNVGEAEDCARAVGACSGLFSRVFREKMTPWPGRAIYLFTSQKQFRAALDKHPEISASTRKTFRNFTAAWVDGKPKLLTWSEDRRMRQELCARQVIGQNLMWRFGLTTKQGWAWEGIGIYLTELLVGTKRVYYQWIDRHAADRTDTNQKWTKDLEKVGWVNVARRLLDNGKLPRLAFLVSKDVNAMKAEDLIASYSFAAFLLEGHARKVRPLLKAVGKEAKHARDGFVAVLGMDLPVVEKRWHAWMGER